MRFPVLKCLLLSVLSCLTALSFGQDHAAQELLLKAGLRDFQEQRYEAAEAKARAVFDESVTLEDNLLKGESSLLIGKIYHKSGKYLVALEYLFISLKVFENNRSRKTEILSTVGDLYYDWGRYRKSLDYYLEADSISSRIEQTKYLKEATGDAYLRLNLPETALACYDACLKLTDDKEYDNRFKLYKKKGDIYLSLQRYDEALAMSFAQLNLIPATSRPANRPVVLNNIGYLYNYRKDYGAALRYFKESRQASLAMGKTDSLYITLINIGAIHHIRGYFDSSLSVLNEALSLVRHRAEKEATVQNYLAATLIELKQYSEALDHNDVAISLSRQNKNASLLAESYYIRSKIFEKRGKTKEQKHFHDLYTRLKDSLDLHAVIVQKQKSALDSLAHVEEKKIQIDLLHKEIDYLASKKIELQARQHEKDRMLLAREIELRKMALYSETLEKAQAQRMWLLTQKELENEKKAREILSLQRDTSEQKLHAQLTTAKLNYAEQQNLKKELELNKSQQVLLWLLISFSMAILLIFILLYLRLRQNAKANKLKLANMEIQQRLLRSQMNPHFLYNSLNSIQGFITSNNTGKADRFLACYARLMRSILENTSKEKVLLQDELNALKSYIELEQMRHDNIFTYAIHVRDLEEDIVAIPPMLVQPYVENAILHGLRHKQGGGLLNISLQREEDYLRCEIVDNGIGRKASGKLNSGKSKDYRSVAMNLTRERLQLLNRQENSNMQVHIEDLVSPEGHPAGTRVTLKIALDEWF